MKTKKVFMLVIFFSILIFISLFAFATNSSEKQASDFQSNGDLIEGWYWLRDSACHQYAEWTFDNIPLSPEEITVKINALDTDRPSGGRGFDAKFLLYYSPRGEGPILTMLIPPQTVILKNVSSPDDPLGYNCQGQVTIPASSYPGGSRISLRIRRESAQDNHVAFKEDSIVLLTDAIYPPNGDHSPNDDDFEGAVPIQPGTYTGSLGEEDEEGHRDNRDYYSIDLEEGQQITLQLTIPGNAQYGISLLNPKRNSLGSSITQRDIKTLDYVANSIGTWYIKIHRSSGEGEYQLAVNTSFDGGGGPGNHSPVISSLDPDQDSIEINHHVEITCNASDQDGDTLRFSWTANGANVGGNNSSLSWRAPATTGTYTITCTVNDSKGGQDRESVSITVTEMSSTCTYTLAMYKYTMSFSGGICSNSNWITTSSPDCQWIAEIDVSWIHFLRGSSEASGTGFGNLEFTVSNNNGEERTGHINVGNQVITIVQDAKPCNCELSSYNSHFASSGGNGEFTVTPSYSDCQWTAVSDVPWVEIVSGGNGPGNKTLSFSVQSNISQEERTGQITIEENKIHTITQAATIEFNLNLSNQGRTLTSNLPIFVSETEKGSEIDLDNDGIHQQWENDAMECINPNFELDEDEDWFDHPEHHVVNFVRVFPYERGFHKYILFTYCVTWSRDYGRADIAGHNGDVERVIMAWEVIDGDGKILELRRVFTSAHGDENDHSAAWDAWNRNCFTRGISAWPFDEEMCGQLVFEENILKLQVSEDKHAIYPTVSCCEDVTLLYLVVVNAFVMEDCGGGNTWRFGCYNAGEPNHHLINDLDNPSSWEGLSEGKLNSLTNLFSQEQVWGGNKNNSNKFCGGLVCDGSSITDMDSPGTIGNKLENLPNMLTDEL